ncbi:MAG: hypothetical protein WBQ73_01025, partial [Candidatus Babeliales bacterium]
IDPLILFFYTMFSKNGKQLRYFDKLCQKNEDFRNIKNAFDKQLQKGGTNVLVAAERCGLLYQRLTGLETGNGWSQGQQRFLSFIKTFVSKDLAIGDVALHIKLTRERTWVSYKYRGSGNCQVDLLVPKEFLKGYLDDGLKNFRNKNMAADLFLKYIDNYVSSSQLHSKSLTYDLFEYWQKSDEEQRELLYRFFYNNMDKLVGGGLEIDAESMECFLGILGDLGCFSTYYISRKNELIKRCRQSALLGTQN